MAQVFARAERLSVDLFGRNIAHVLLLHANALNSDLFGELAHMLQERGYRFVSLDTALGDPAYGSSLGLTSIEGESWLENWARVAGLHPGRETPVLDFVRRWAGAAALRGY